MYNLLGLLQALQQQRKSLETLCITPGDHDPTDDPFAISADVVSRGGLSCFPKLHTVTIDGRNYGLEELLTMPELAPPDLESIHILGVSSISSSTTGVMGHTDFMDAVNASNSRLAQWFQGTASIKTLRQVSVTFDRLSASCFSDSSAVYFVRRALIEWAAELLSSREVALAVHTRSPGYKDCPLYLYDNPDTPSTLIYHSEQGGWLSAEASGFVAQEDDPVNDTMARNFLATGFTVDLDNPAPSQ